MKKFLLLLTVVAIALPEAASSVTPSKSVNYKNNGVKLMLADPSGSVYKEGEPIRFSVQTDSDAYVVVFDIDTEGFVHLLYPTNHKSLREFEAGQTYDLARETNQPLVVTGKTGMEFVFAVAVTRRDAINEREISYLVGNEKLPQDRKYRIDGDPFLAANRVAGQLVRGIAYADDASLAYTYFYVNEAVDYPRYLCEDCYEKGKDPYSLTHDFVATSAFSREDNLSYPLEAGFERSYDDIADEESDEAGDSEDTTVTKEVHVYRYVDRHGWGWPYYGYGYPYFSSFYFGIGWDWGWGVGFGWRYPYYGYGWRYPYHYGYGYGYCYPYYRAHYWGYGHGYGYGYHHYPLTYRKLRPGRTYGTTGLGGYKSRDYSSKRETRPVRFRQSDRERGDQAYRTYRSKPRPVRKVTARNNIRGGKSTRGYRAEKKIRPNTRSTRGTGKSYRSGQAKRDRRAQPSRAVRTHGEHKRYESKGNRPKRPTSSKRSVRSGSSRAPRAKSSVGRSAAPRGGRSAVRGSSKGGSSRSSKAVRGSSRWKSRRR